MTIDFTQKLSEHFSLGEFTINGSAMPPEARKFFKDEDIIRLLPMMKVTAEGLEKVRTLLKNSPIKVHCGYRPKTWELYRKRSGKSQHTVGNAVDFSCASFGIPFEVAKFISIYKKEIQYDQLIHEYQWVHISFVEKNPRMNDLTLNLKTQGYDYGIHN